MTCLRKGWVVLGELMHRNTLPDEWRVFKHKFAVRIWFPYMGDSQPTYHWNTQRKKWSTDGSSLIDTGEKLNNQLEIFGKEAEVYVRALRNHLSESGGHDENSV